MQPELTEAKQARVRRLYKRQLEGLSSTALVYDHAEKEQVSIQTAWRDWADVKKIVDEDWKADPRKYAGASSAHAYQTL
tara:strand:- start:114 stop:350 length:237 start_codon:yes stop_codon:yes gene_type:complete